MFGSKYVITRLTTVSNIENILQAGHRNSLLINKVPSMDRRQATFSSCLSSSRFVSTLQVTFKSENNFRQLPERLFWESAKLQALKQNNYASSAQRDRTLRRQVANTMVFAGASLMRVHADASQTTKSNFYSAVSRVFPVFFSCALHSASENSVFDFSLETIHKNALEKPYLPDTAVELNIDTCSFTFWFPALFGQKYGNLQQLN